MTDDLNTIAADLEAAKADLALLERLTSAAERVNVLTTAFDKARTAQAKADEASAKEAAEARFKGLANIRVTGSGDDNLLREHFTINWTGQVYDMYSMTSAPIEMQREGFVSLPDNVLAFLVEKHPDRIPAKITALRPGDPAAAMTEYLRACQRGYFRGAK